MPPLLVSDDHDKQLMSSDDYFGVDNYQCYESFKIKLGPDDTVFDYKVCFSVELGLGFVSINDLSNSKIIGNLIYKATSTHLASVTGAPSVQVSSVVIDDEYRGIGLGVQAYEALSRYFHIVSDDIQTIDGAALWKNKISRASSLNVQVILDYDTNPRLLLNSNEQIEIYNPDKIELEKLIWSAKNSETVTKAQELGIDASLGSHYKSRVLVAVRKKQIQH